MERRPKPHNAKPSPDNPPSRFDVEDTVRHEKVAQLKQALQDGTYHISSDEVARKVIDHMLRPKG